MKKTLKIFGLSLLLILAMALFVAGPLYGLPVGGGKIAIKDYLGNIILGFLGINLPDNILYYAIITASSLFGITFTVFIFLFIIFIKKEKKVSEFKKKAKEVSEVRDSIKIKTPEPLANPQNLHRGGGHNNLKF